jgi:hypothetical protein
MRRYYRREKEPERPAGVIKNELENAAFENQPVSHVAALTAICEALIAAAERLAGH